MMMKSVYPWTSGRKAWEKTTKYGLRVSSFYGYQPHQLLLRGCLLEPMTFQEFLPCMDVLHSLSQLIDSGSRVAPCMIRQR